MKRAVLILLLIASTAHAGRWRDFCERHLVGPNPYEHETADTARVAGLYQVEAARAYFTRRPSSDLRVLGNELRSRRPLTDEIESMLETYNQWEYIPGR